MNIKMRAKQIDISENDPFKNDLFNRQTPVENLKNLIGNLESPAVVAIDGAWGTGKTTFLNLWIQSLLNDELPVVQFNAWENDFSPNAIVSITHELTAQLRDCDAKFGIKDMLREKAVQFLKEAATASIKVASGGILNIESKTNGREIFSEVKAYKEQMDKFRQSLGKLAGSYKNANSYPLVIVIDELDRCRPMFAIDILEVAKHLFSTRDVVFVLALNRRELSHSIASAYGERFDSIGYMERFIDVEFHLPPAGRKQFLLSQLSEKCRERYDENSEFHDAMNVMFAIYDSPDFNLRTASHYVRRLDYVFASIRFDTRFNFPIALVAALVARSIDLESYLRFKNSEISDDEFADSIFEREGMRGLRQSSEGAWIEAVLIATQRERERIRMNDENTDTSHSSSLFQKYREIVNDEKSTSTEKRHASEVIGFIEQDENLQKIPPFPTLAKHYLHAVELIEMISPNIQ